MTALEEAPARGGPAPPLVTVTTRVQHHPARADQLPPLLERLAGLAPVVVEDPDPTSRLRSPWRTYRQCVQPITTSHLLVVQDDVIPCLDFAAAVHHVAQEKPDALVALCLPGSLGLVAKVATLQAAKGERYVSLDRGPWVPVIALLWPRALLEGFLQVCDDWARANPKPQVSDDAIVGRFRRESKCEAFATVPSLVQHPDTVPSIVTGRPAPTGRNKLRIAHQWRGPEWSPVATGWTSRVDF